MNKGNDMDKAVQLSMLMERLERVADELDDMGYLEVSRKIDDLICELDFEMCACSVEG